MKHTKDFLNVQKRKEFRSFTRNTVYEQAEKEGGKAFAEALDGLIDKGLIRAERMESGEFRFYPTEVGKVVITALNEQDDDDED